MSKNADFPQVFLKNCKTKMASKYFSRRPGCLVLSDFPKKYASL